jgi:hypothetical protein
LPDLIGAKIKIGRAKSHLEELGTKVNEFLGNQSFRVEVSEDDEGDLVYRIKIGSLVPVEWSAIVGDIVHNLRSALDQLAWQLVLLNGNTPGRNTYFPIALAKTGYGKQLRASLNGASDRARTLVRRLKPYPEGNLILSQVHALDVCDKHRLTLIVGSAHKHVLVTMKMEADWIPEDFKFPTIALNPADRQFPLKDGEEVFRVKKAARKGNVMGDHGLVFELAFGDVDEVKGLPLLETLNNMVKHVEKIVEIFNRRYF